MKPELIYAIIVGAYGIVVGTMGLYGYVTAKSVPSVIAGELGFAACALAAGFIWVKHSAGFPIALATSGLLALVFLIRFANTKKLMPAGFLFALSLVVVVALAAKML